MTSSNTYLAIHEEMVGASEHYLALAAQLGSPDSIMANRLRLMAELGRKIVESTEQRIQNLAAGGGPS